MTPPNSQRLNLASTGDLKPLKRVWEFGYNTCHAPIVMRSDLQQQMKKAHTELGMKYWRCHGILSDDVGVVAKDRDGKEVYSFSGLKRILDGGIATGMTPFLEFSFMPSCLARDPKQTITHYRGITSPPKDFQEWGKLVTAVTNFLIESYGAKTLENWRFEIWNEPNIPFWRGTKEEYFKLYRHAAIAIKDVHPKLLVGGPATARGEWVSDFLKYCEDTKTPVDFLSTHIYPSDVEFMDSAEGKVELFGLEFLYNHFKRVYEEVQQIRPGLPIIWGEWNSSAGPLAENHDESNNAALVAGAIAGIETYADGSLFWGVSDIYEECKYHFLPFHGGYGFYNVDDLPKASANAFGFLHQLEEFRVAVEGLDSSVSRGVLASVDQSGKSLIAVFWNHHEPSVNEHDWSVTLSTGDKRIKSGTLDSITPGKGSPFEKWLEMGNPANLSVEQLKLLQEASKPVHHKIVLNGSTNEYSFTVPSRSLFLIKMQLI